MGQNTPDYKLIYQQLLDKLNPGLTIRNKFHNILVQHKESVPVVGDSEYVSNHEIHYDSEGRLSITENAVGPFGETVKEYFESLNMILEDNKKHPVLTQEEFDSFSNR